MSHIERDNLCNPSDGKYIYIPLSASSKTSVESNDSYYIQIRDLDDYTIVRLTPFNGRLSFRSINKDVFFSTYNATIPVTSGKKTLSTREELNSFLSKVLSDNAEFIITTEKPVSGKPLIRLIQAELESMGQDASVQFKKRFSNSLQSLAKIKEVELDIEATRKPLTQPAIRSLESNAAPQLSVSLSAPKPQNQNFFKQASPYIYTGLSLGTGVISATLLSLSLINPILGAVLLMLSLAFGIMAANQKNTYTPAQAF